MSARTCKVMVPHGAFPSYAQGYYDRDSAFYREWTPIFADLAKTIRRWVQEKVIATPDHAAHPDAIGREQLARLEVAPRPASPVDYGRRPR